VCSPNPYERAAVTPNCNGRGKRHVICGCLSLRQPEPS
jgi:hypothetical protein